MFLFSLNPACSALQEIQFSRHSFHLAKLSESDLTEQNCLHNQEFDLTTVSTSQTTTEQTKLQSAKNDSSKVYI